MGQFLPPSTPGLASVIIVNWNGLEYLPECLESARRQTYEAKEIIVVENGSSDGSQEWLCRDASRGFRLVALKANTGFAGGTNAGIRTSHGEFIALLNNDAVADESWLANLVREAERPDVGMVASKILFYGRRDIIDKAGHLMYPDGLNRGRGAGETDRGQYNRRSGILFPDGCAALYRREMLEDIGLFDEQFFAYGDDADLGLRARWRGWDCAYSPDARVYHRHSSSLGKYSPEKAFLVERNRMWVAVKLLPWPLLAASPLLTLWRFGWHSASVLSRRGLAGGVRRDYSAWSLFRATLRAYSSGIAGFGQMARKRRAVFRNRKISSAQFLRLLREYRISARELAFRD